MNPLFAAVLLALALVGACKKDPPAPLVVQSPGQPVNAPTPAGSDANRKRVEALELAARIDAALATYQREEKTLPAVAGTSRTAEAWTASGKGNMRLPKKIIVTANDGKGSIETTDLYFDDSGLLQFARATDGLFVFQMESLALWLDRDQKVKRGLNPSLTMKRVAALMGDSRAALSTFGLR